MISRLTGLICQAGVFQKQRERARELSGIWIEPPLITQAQTKNTENENVNT